jgi:hypothetical protein
MVHVNKTVKRNKRRGARRASGGRQTANAVGTYASDAWSLAKRTAVGLNEIRKLINVEQKFSEISSSGTFDRTTGIIGYLSGCSQGDSTITREGNSIKIQHFRLRYDIVHNSADTAGAVHRVLLVRDLQNQGATITVGDVFESGTLATSRAPLAFYNFINGALQNKRFSILYDSMVTTSPYEPVYSDDFESSHDCHIYYRGTDATVASAGNGSYFLVALSSPTANPPTIFWNSRIEFTDN